MAKYLITLETTASAYIEVEADSKEAAVELAFERAPGICASCSGWSTPGVSMDLGEFDVPHDRDGNEADYAVEELDS